MPIIIEEKEEHLVGTFKCSGGGFNNKRCCGSMLKVYFNDLFRGYCTHKHKYIRNTYIGVSFRCPKCKIVSCVDNYEGEIIDIAEKEDTNNTYIKSDLIKDVMDDINKKLSKISDGVSEISKKLLETTNTC